MSTQTISGSLRPKPCTHSPLIVSGEGKRIGVHSLPESFSSRLTFDCFQLQVCHLLMYYLAILLKWNSPGTFLKLFKSPTASVLSILIKSSIQFIFSSEESMLHKQAICEFQKLLLSKLAKFKLHFCDLHENNKSFHFETEAWGNSEIAD